MRCLANTIQTNRSLAKYKAANHSCMNAANCLDFNIEYDSK